MASDLERLKQCIETLESPEVEPYQNIPNFGVAVNRFVEVYKQSGYFTPDTVSLLRQAVRRSEMVSLRIDRPVLVSDDFDKWLDLSGLDWTTSGYLSALPFSLDCFESGPVIVDDLPRKRFVDESLPAEYYLKQRLNFDIWLSPAQKEASWSVINASPGSTSIIVLPTGCGKSSCFLLLAAFSQGLTVVVVPTVALAIDQQIGAEKRFENVKGINPLYFASNDNSEEVVLKLQNKESRLVFASPETCVSGKLRPLLDKFAQNGWLQNIVVDEAHLIETWGAQFRLEFQILAAVRKKWLASSDGQMRTFLFSATMSSQCRNTLGEMFSNPGEVNEFVCQRLRPEMVYYSRMFQDSKERWPYLRRVIWQSPRPAIIYLTKPCEASALYDTLVDDEGFSRVGLFTGDTPPSERKRLLSAWRGNEIDLMVATSAFGVGVDKPDVRTIVHACYPENLDRYYQEVGRSGRDGYSSICLLLPTQADVQTAKGLGMKLLKDSDVIQQRWDAMYAERRDVGGESFKFKVPVSVKRSDLLGGRTYKTNVKWNKSLLLQLYRAKLLDFIDLEYERSSMVDDEPDEWATVVVDFSPGTKELAQKIEQHRLSELDSFHAGFNQMSELFSNKKCISRVFQNIYNIKNHQRVCGGCRYCRNKSVESGSCPPLVIPNDLREPSNQSGTIVEGCPNPLIPEEQDFFIDIVDLCLGKHQLYPLQLICPSDHYVKILQLLSSILPYYNSLYRIDSFSEKIRFRRGGRPIFVHIANYSERMMRFGQDAESIHLFCGVIDRYDPVGRHIKIKYNCEVWPSPQAWIDLIR